MTFSLFAKPQVQFSALSLDITDYRDIILKNWELFEGRFKEIGLGKEKFEHGMTELNRIRRKVMHLRDIRSSEAKTLRLYIIPELEEIFT
jgi:hypothetical protein